MGVSHTLKDIRPKAEEKARRKAEGLLQEAPSGDGFMSERTRAKEVLREEVNTYTGENVRKIAATAAAGQEDRILRVVAYCRVSTDDIDAFGGYALGTSIQPHGAPVQRDLPGVDAEHHAARVPPYIL